MCLDRWKAFAPIHKLHFYFPGEHRNLFYQQHCVVIHTAEEFLLHRPPRLVIHMSHCDFIRGRIKPKAVQISPFDLGEAFTEGKGQR